MAAKGFQALPEFFGTSRPNQPVLFPERASVAGNQPFLAMMPIPTKSIIETAPIAGRCDRREPNRPFLPFVPLGNPREASAEAARPVPDTVVCG